jgi:hypothetical protein
MRQVQREFSPVMRVKIQRFQQLEQPKYRDFRAIDGRLNDLRLHSTPLVCDRSTCGRGGWARN